MKNATTTFCSINKKRLIYTFTLRGKLCYETNGFNKILIHLKSKWGFLCSLVICGYKSNYNIWEYKKHKQERYSEPNLFEFKHIEKWKFKLGMDKWICRQSNCLVVITEYVSCYNWMFVVANFGCLN